MTTPSTPKVAILGAGPGGCMLARLLNQHSIPCTIFESEASIDYRSQGGSLDLRSTTGLATIKAAGLWTEFQKQARYDGESLLITDKKLTTWMRRRAYKGRKVNNLQEAPEIDRAVLRRILMESLPQGIVRWNHHLTHITTPADSSPVLHFRNGAIESGYDLIVGADGAFSKVRSVLSDVKPFHSGYGGYWLTLPSVPTTSPALDKLVNKGNVFAYSDHINLNGQQLGHNNDLSISLVSPRAEDWTKTSGFDPTDLESAKKDMLQLLDGWDPLLLDLVKHAQGPVMARNLYMLPVGFTFPHKRGITLLGDAAHLMTPFAGIGVNSAFYDAMLLSDAIVSSINDTTTNPDKLDKHVQEYETKMLAHGKAGQALTWNSMEALMMTSGAPRQGIERWLLGHLREEVPVWSRGILSAVVYVGYFFYKMFV
ncbi:FAD/NAD(P)-binding domain-containing protein [Amniculicola lignicola CBS 123094]|uniref:FAD/NAD(P)-binding domain-containing protein n=1 Tax=Amniculicola lignicola CBS 123094 TaxID=1392246 RepID=A0A6A5W918_9PLEO|nr:FAD/NAD(P)-binding domain-containing protein [Amniculicola lignicola CBS 123094]